MYYALIAVYVLVCLVLSLVVLLQQGRGGDIASAFGGSIPSTGGSVYAVADPRVRFGEGQHQ